MIGIATAMRTAVDEALRQSPDVSDAFAPSTVRLYPLAAPTNSAFPYVIYRVDVGGDDTQCGEGSDVAVSLEVFARQETYLESVEMSERIATAARRVLTADLDPTDHTIDDWTFEFDRTVRDPNPLTAHRSVQITYLTSAAA